MEIDGLNILLVPKSIPDSSELEQRERVVKMHTLAGWEADDLARIDELLSREAGASGKAEGGDSAVGSALTRILDNISFKLTNIHIRVEDSVSLGAGERFAMGLTIDEVRLASCGDDWIPRFLDDVTSPLIHKLGAVRAAVAYLDRKPAHWLSAELLNDDSVSAAGLFAPLRGLRPRPDTVLLASVEVQVKAVVVRHPTAAPDQPRVRASLAVLGEGIRLRLGDDQFGALAAGAAFASLQDKLYHHALASRSQLHAEPVSDADRALYRALFAIRAASADSADAPRLNASQVDALSALELKLPLDELRRLRRDVHYERRTAEALRRREEARRAAAAKPVGVLAAIGSWFGGGQKKSSALAEPVLALTPEQETAALCEMLGYADEAALQHALAADDVTTLPPAYVKLHCALAVPGASLELVSVSSGCALLRAALTELRGEFAQRRNGFDASVQLHALRAHMPAGPQMPSLGALLGALADAPDVPVLVFAAPAGTPALDARLSRTAAGNSTAPDSFVLGLSAAPLAAALAPSQLAPLAAFFASPARHAIDGLVAAYLTQLSEAQQATLAAYLGRTQVQLDVRTGALALLLIDDAVPAAHALCIHAAGLAGASTPLDTPGAPAPPADGPAGAQLFARHLFTVSALGISALPASAVLARLNNTSDAAAAHEGALPLLQPLTLDWHVAKHLSADAGSPPAPAYVSVDCAVATVAWTLHEAHVRAFVGVALRLAAVSHAAASQGPAEPVAAALAAEPEPPPAPASADDEWAALALSAPAPPPSLRVAIRVSRLTVALGAGTACVGVAELRGLAANIAESADEHAASLTCEAAALYDALGLGAADYSNLASHAAGRGLLMLDEPASVQTRLSKSERAYALVARCGAVAVAVRRTAVLRILRFLHAARLFDVSASQAQPRPAVVRAPAARAPAGARALARSHSSLDCPALRLTLYVGEQVESQAALACLTLSGLALSLRHAIDQSALDARLALRAISLVDAQLPVGARHAALLATPDAEVIAASLSYAPGADVNVAASLGRVCVAATARSWAPLRQYVAGFWQMRALIDSASRTAVSRARQSLAAATAPGACIVLRAHVAAPLLLLPLHGDSPVIAALDLGSTQLEARFAPDRYDLSVGVSCVNAYLHDGACGDAPRRPLVEPCDVAVRISGVTGRTHLAATTTTHVQSRARTADLVLLAMLLRANGAGALDDALAAAIAAPPADPDLALAAAPAAARDASAGVDAASAAAAGAVAELVVDCRVPLLSVSLFDPASPEPAAAAVAAVVVSAADAALSVTLRTPASGMSSWQADASLARFAIRNSSVADDDVRAVIAESRGTEAERTLVTLTVSSAADSASPVRAVLVFGDLTVRAAHSNLALLWRTVGLLPQRMAAAAAPGPTSAATATHAATPPASAVASGAAASTTRTQLHASIGSVRLVLLQDTLLGAVQPLATLAVSGASATAYLAADENRYAIELRTLSLTDDTPWAGRHACAVALEPGSALALHYTQWAPGSPLRPSPERDACVRLFGEGLRCVLLYRFAMDAADYASALSAVLAPLADGPGVAVPPAPFVYALALELTRPSLQLPRNCASEAAIRLDCEVLAASNVFTRRGEGAQARLYDCITFEASELRVRAAGRPLVPATSARLELRRCAVAEAAIECDVHLADRGLTLRLCRDSYTLVCAFAREAMAECDWSRAAGFGAAGEVVRRVSAEAYALKLDALIAEAQAAESLESLDARAVLAAAQQADSQADARCSVRMRLFVDALAVEFARASEGAEAELVARAQLAGLRVDTWQLRCGVLWLQALCPAVQVEDARPGSLAACRLLLARLGEGAPGASGASAAALDAARQLRVAGVHHPPCCMRPGMAYAIDLDSSRALVYADALAELWALLFPIDATPEPADYAAARSVGRAAAPVDDSLVRLDLLVTRPQLCFVADLADESAQAIVLELTLQLAMRSAGSRSTSTLALRDLEVFACNMGAISTSAVGIIDPLSLSCDYATTAEGASLVVNSAEIGAFFAYSDVAKLAAALAVLGSPTERLARPANTAHLPVRRDYAAPTRALAPAAAPATAESPPLVLFVQQQSLRVILVNDSLGENVPLLRAKLRLSAERSAVPLVADAVLSVTFFNSALRAWEPLVESVQLRAHYGPQSVVLAGTDASAPAAAASAAAAPASAGGGDDAPTLPALAITADAPLVLNVTREALAALSEAQTFFATDASSASASACAGSAGTTGDAVGVAAPRASRRLPMVLHNHTGECVRLFANSDLATAIARLEPGASGRVFSTQATRKRRQLAGAENDGFTLHVVSSTGEALCQPLVGLALSVAGSSVHRLRDRAGADAGCLFVSVELTDATGHAVRLLSGLVLANESSLAWALSYGALWDAPAPLAPGSLCAVPLTVLARAAAAAASVAAAAASASAPARPGEAGAVPVAAAVRVRPVMQGDEYKWADATLDWRTYALADTTRGVRSGPQHVATISASPRAGASLAVPVRSVVFAQPIVAGMAASFVTRMAGQMPLHRLTLHDALVLTSALCVPLAFEVFAHTATGTGAPLHVGQLEPCTSQSLATVDMRAAAFAMRIQLAGFNWSSTAVVALGAAGGADPATCVFALQTAGAGANLLSANTPRCYLKYTCARNSETGIHELIVYADYWFVNCTPWDVHLAASSADASTPVVLPGRMVRGTDGVARHVYGLRFTERLIHAHRRELRGRLRRLRAQLNAPAAASAEADGTGAGGAAGDDEDADWEAAAGVRVRVRADTSDWSETGFDPAGKKCHGSLHSVSAHADVGGARYVFRVSSKRGVGSLLWRTRIVTLAPVFVVENRCRQALEVRQFSDAAPAVSLEPGATWPIVWPDGQGAQALVVRPGGAGARAWHWSTPVPCIESQIADYPLMLCNGESGLRRYTRMRMVQLESSGSIAIVFADDVPYAPYRVANLTALAVSFTDRDSPLRQVVASGSIEPYVPPGVVNADQRFSLVLSIAGLERVYDSTLFRTQGLVETIPLALGLVDHETHAVVHVSVLADGPTMVLQLHQRRVDPHEFAATVDTFTRWAEKNRLPPQRPFAPVVPFKLVLSLVALGVSFVVPHHPTHGHRGELMYLELSAVRLAALRKGATVRLDVSVLRAQADALGDRPGERSRWQAPSRLVLYSQVPEAEGGDLSFCQASVTLSTASFSMLYFERAYAMLGKLEVSLDTTLVQALVSLGTGEAESGLGDAAAELELAAAQSAALGALAVRLGASETGRVWYFSALRLPALAMSLTFVAQAARGAGVGGATARGSSFSSSLWLQLTSLDRGRVRLDGLDLVHLLTSPTELAHRISEHYTGELLGSAIFLLGSSELLGNPFGLVADLRTGVTDAFYEPAMAVLEGPDAFASGLVFGGKSLLMHTAHGLFSTTGKIASTVGQSVAALSFDSDYTRQRSAERMSDRPTTVHGGVGSGALKLGKGIASGVTGVFTAPVAGARKSGLGGLLRGVAKGAAGLITKPIVGALDLVDDVSTGIRSATTMRRELAPALRGVRVVGDSVPLAPLAQRMIAAQACLWLLRDELYWSGETLTCAEVLRGPQRLVVTDSRVMLLSASGSSWEPSEARLALIDETALRDVQAAQPNKAELVLTLVRSRGRPAMQLAFGDKAAFGRACSSLGAGDN